MTVINVPELIHIAQ